MKKVLIFAALFFATTSTFAQEINPLTGQVAVITGADLATNTNAATRDAYIEGVLDGATTMNSAFTLVCQDESRFTKDQIAEQIWTSVHGDHALQNQTIVFSILNAYNKLYCPAKK